MTKTIDCTTWEEFLVEISTLAERRKTDSRLRPELLFRGHADSSWRLDSTLDRIGKAGMQFSEYYRLIAVAQNEIEAFTGHRWETPYYPDLEPKFRDWDFVKNDRDFHSIYGYMTHLRHYGYPSPLIDWTRSAHIAAYFAFARASSSEQVSIYVLAQARMSASSSGKPQVVILGPNVRTHQRHFLQQCEYSLCVQFDNDWIFADHETAFRGERSGARHPVNSSIFKFNLPSRERLKVLKILDSLNLNAFSLFGSEESLMETLSMRQLML